MPDQPLDQPVVSIKRDYRRSVLTWLHLVRIYHRVAREEQNVLAAHELTPSQFDVLSHIATAPGLNQQALADRLLVTKGNVCGLVDRLESAGLVERRAAPTDRRVHLLHLTPEGQRAFDDAAPDLEASLDAQFDALTEADRVALASLLGKWDRTLRTS